MHTGLWNIGSGLAGLARGASERRPWVRIAIRIAKISLYIELTKSNFCDSNFYPPKGTIELLPMQVATKAILHLTKHENSKEQRKTAGVLLFFRQLKGRQARISAEYETALAINFLEKQRKQRERRARYHACLRAW